MDFLVFDNHLVPQQSVRGWLEQCEKESPDLFHFPGQAVYFTPAQDPDHYYFTYTLPHAMERFTKFLKDSNISLELVHRDDLPWFVKETANDYFSTPSS